MHQDEVLRKVIEKYNQCQPGQYKITRFPDKEKTAAPSRNCDAYAEADLSFPLALEHTRVETFKQQIEDSARFSKSLAKPLETRFKDIKFSISLTVKPFAFPKGSKFREKEMISHLSEWLEPRAEQLPMGRTDHEIPGIPFRLTIDKRIGSNRFRVGRWAPAEEEIEIELAQNMINAIKDKDDQLARYRAAGDHTILVMESTDIALVNHAMLYQAYLVANELTESPNIDEVWMAETYDPDEVIDIWCFKATQEIMERANPENFMFGPQHSKYWSSHIEGYKARMAQAISQKYVPLSRRS